MNKKRLFVISGFISLLAISCFVSLNNKKDLQVYAYEDMSLVGEGDNFRLFDKQYGEDESFVYTADLHFNDGNAGGLAFGSEQDDHYYVVNMDRHDNRVKLIYFATKEDGGYTPTEIKSDYFIGNDKITENELAYVNPQVAGIEVVNLKVVLTRENEHAYLEFYVEGIKRFGIDTVIDLNNVAELPGITYKGGYLGMNCFNANITLRNIEIGKSDYSYFTEQYRNQYHLQPFAKWSNDPNALCYYSGYYHVFYQTYPFGLQWGPMYWGHARSVDLIHFEYLPICLFPENNTSEFGPNTGWMWSGCAITYKYGMIEDIDSKNWFTNGSGSGLLAIFTRDGGYQDQVLMSSDDEGLTWTKRHRIPQAITGISDHKIDWRDPKVFALKKDGTGKVTDWGMTLSSYALNKGWFLSSKNLLDWKIAGSFPLPTPECIGVGFLKDEDDVEHAYLTNKSRGYILGTLEYNESTGEIKFFDENNVDISTYTVDTIPLKALDFGPDSYASQSFYIDDPDSDYYGKDIVLNWFSGDLNASFCTGPGEYAGLRKRWNGGFTTPVEYGIYKDSAGEYRLSQKPITVNNPHLQKDNLVDIENKAISYNSVNPLRNVHTHIFELIAEIKTNDESAISFKVDVGENEYMAFGWNSIDGYYVDRTYLDSKGINTNIDWHVKYASNIKGDSDVKTFYVLSDNGGLEVFCENFSISFYFVTTASIYSTGASLTSANAVINILELNEIASAYQKNVDPSEGVLYVSSDDVTLDNTFATSKFVTCWYSGSLDLNWEVIENEDIVEYKTSNQGILLTAKNEGSAQFKVSAGECEDYIDVKVYNSSFDSDLTFKKENVVSGSWVMGDGFISGEMPNGNGFLLSEESGNDFTYTGQFELDGVAASLVFRATKDLSNYIVANYDSNERIVKLWSRNGEIARSKVIDVDLNNIVLSVKATGKNIQVMLNGAIAIECQLNDNEPLEGLYGVNVFSSRAQFKSLAIAKENYEYSSGELEISLGVDQFVSAIYNVNLGNRLINSDYYYQFEGKLYIKESYFDLLAEDGMYQFRIVGSSYTFVVKVDIKLQHSEFAIEDVVVELGNDVVVYIGNNKVNKVVINGKDAAETAYFVKDYSLHISKELFNEGENNVVVNEDVSFKVTVKNIDEVIIDKTTTIDYTPVVIGSVSGGTVGIAGIGLVIFFLIRRRRVL